MNENFCPKTSHITSGLETLTKAAEKIIDSTIYLVTGNFVLQ